MLAAIKYYIHQFLLILNQTYIIKIYTIHLVEKDTLFIRLCQIVSES